MSRARSGFDRLASVYRALEFAAFGRDLERARFQYLGQLAGCRDILLLGEGDGRCALRLASLAPQARILCVDSSPAMIERASRRLNDAGFAGRVAFACADLREYRPPPGSFDAVATLFVLDCFHPGEVASIVARVGPALRPGGRWLFADFALPPRGVARIRARAWLGLLYFFFRLGAGLRVSELPPSEAILERSGWRRWDHRALQGGMVMTAVYGREGGPPTGARSAAA